MNQSCKIILVCSLLTLTASTNSISAAVDQAVIAEQQRRIKVVETVAKSVVAIFAPGGQGGGSGVLISPDGYALSNFHVTQVRPFLQCGLNDGVLYDAVLVGVDPTGDVALIKLLGRDDFPTANLGDSDKVKVGDWAYAMGNPFLLATDFQPTVTYGIVSGVHRYQYPAGQDFLEYGDCIQVDSSINPGNSGGPLFNDQGDLIGINGRGSFEKRGRVNSGAGYAISINQIKHFMDHLKSGRIVDHATLGASVITAPEGEIIIGSILEQSAAFRRGLRIDDEIVSFAGRSIRSVNQYKNILSIYPKGWKLPLVFRRDAEKVELAVRLRGLHRKSQLTPKKRGPARPKQPMPKKPEKEEKDSDDKKEDKKKPKQIPAHANLHAPAKHPEKYKHMYISKEGYANYYFNKLQQERLLKSLSTLGDFSQLAGTWNIAGKTNTGTEFTFTLADKGLGLELGNDAYFQPLDGSDLQDEPPGSGGLLIAMQHLRLLLTTKGTHFTELYYLGSEPLDGNSNLMADVLITSLTGVDSRWYFSRKTGEFLGFDTQLFEDVDACEIRFDGQRPFDQIKLPERLHVQKADQEIATFQIQRVQLTPGSAPDRKPATKASKKPAKEN